MKMAPVIRELVAAGVTGDALVTAIERIEAAQEPKLSKGAERTRRWREKRHSDVTRDVSPSLNDYGSNLLPSLSNLKPTPSPPIVPPVPLDSPSLDFGKIFDARFWPNYPKREGNNSRKNARQRFISACKGGADPEQILLGESGYANHCSKKQIIGTPLVKTAEAWLLGAMWEGFQPVAEPIPRANGPPPGCRTTEEILAEIEEQKRGRTGDIRELPQNGSGPHPAGEEDREGPLFCDQARNGRVGQMDRVFHDVLRAASMGNAGRFEQS